MDSYAADAPSSPMMAPASSSSSSGSNRGDTIPSYNGCLYKLLDKVLDAKTKSIRFVIAHNTNEDATDKCKCRVVTANINIELNPSNVVLTEITDKDNSRMIYILPHVIAGFLYIAFNSKHMDSYAVTALHIEDWAHAHKNEIINRKIHPSKFIEDNTDKLKKIWTDWKSFITQFANPIL